MNSQVLIDRELLKELASFCSDSRSYNEAMRVLAATPAPIPDAGEGVEVRPLTQHELKFGPLLYAERTADKYKTCRHCGGYEALLDLRYRLHVVSALQASAMVVPDGLALMPRALTAENGAKAAMLGEFVIRLERHCSSCVDEAGDLSCDECGGDVEYVESVSVDWPTIKDIYAKAVDLLAASHAPGDSQ